MRTSHRNKGFTLIEVLAALLILALAMGALQLRMASHLDNTAYLREISQASWVAQNQRAYLTLAAQFGSATTMASGTESLDGRLWYWVLAPVNLPGVDAEMRFTPVQIGVSPVSAEAARLAPMFTLQTLVETPGVL